MLNTENLVSAGATKPADRRVLIVDDELAVRRVLRRWFERRGWRVDEAEDGQDALVKLTPPNPGDASNDKGYELVICDLRMPNASGEDLYHWVGAHRPELLSRLVFASGDVSEVAACEFLRDSGSVVLEKPFELAQLVEVVTRITEANPIAA